MVKKKPHGSKGSPIRDYHHTPAGRRIRPENRSKSTPQLDEEKIREIETSLSRNVGILLSSSNPRRNELKSYIEGLNNEALRSGDAFRFELVTPLGLSMEELEKRRYFKNEMLQKLTKIYKGPVDVTGILEIYAENVDSLEEEIATAPNMIIVESKKGIKSEDKPGEQESLRVEFAYRGSLTDLANYIDALQKIGTGNVRARRMETYVIKKGPSES